MSSLSGQQAVSVAYSDTNLISRDAFVYHDGGGWRLLDNDAAFSMGLPDKWMPFVPYGWMESDNFPVLPEWKPEEHDHWLVILPAHK